MQLLETKEKLEQSVRHLKLLFELESTMSRAASQEELIRGVRFEAAEGCDARGGAVLLSSGGDGGFELSLWDALRPQELRYETWRAPKGASLLPNSTTLRGLLATAMQNAEPVHITDALEDVEPYSVQGGMTLRSALAVPLEWEDGEPMGSMALCDKSEGRPFSAEDVELVRMIAANFCTAIRLFRARIQKEREERLSTIGSLLSNVVHDLKSPIAVASGYVQMMAEASDEKKRREYVALVLKQFDTIAAMQREVLEFARGEKRLLVRKVYLGTFFEELASELKSQLGGTKVGFELELEDRGTARFDQSKIKRVVHNLVRNAVEAMGPKGGTVTLCVSRSPEGKSLVLVVSDTGPGIPKQIESRLFESFVTAGKKGGTGLGLAIVKKIISEHGGTVDVQSTSGGTTFTLTLPQPEMKS
jgi:signal transduction histidine kinase